MTGASGEIATFSWENKLSEAARCVNTERPLTRSLDSTEEGLAMKATRTCSVPRCPEVRDGLGLCRIHYRRFRRHGSPLAYRPTMVGRFWDKVALPDEDGCMLWLGAMMPTGYGSFQTYNAHRFSLWLAEGEPPTGKTDAAHSCRNRHCVAPAHLRWASRLENVADMVRDGTKAMGMRNGQRKLSESQVADIRQRYAAGGITQRELGEEFGVSQTTIRMAVIRRTWNCIPIKES